jgi:hypothetical protein
MPELDTHTAIDRRAEYEKHLEFWQNGLQAIEEISSSLETSLARLEKKYSDFETLYDQAMDGIDALAGIYAGVNTIQGREYVLRLKALMRDYRRRYTLEGINFNAIHFLHSRIRELRDQSFNDFPNLTHTPAETVESVRPERRSIVVRYRWVTFERNGSWFILPYDTLNILELRKANLVGGGRKNRFSLRLDGVVLEVLDLLSSSMAEKTRPSHIMVVGLGGEKFCYAATVPGKRILSRSDFIIEGLRGVRDTGLSRGHIRLFGRKHLYIDPRDTARRNP